MNAFYEHHKDSIRFGCRCFDRILFNGLIQPFQQPERVVGFFDTYRHLYPVGRDVLRGAADQQRDRARLPEIGRLLEVELVFVEASKPDQLETAF
jgi:hypothetical protein